MSVRKKLLAVVLLLVMVMPQTAFAVSQRSATLNLSSKTIDMAEDMTLQLTGSVLPAAASQKMVWKSSNTAIATVTSAGLVRFKKPGTVIIGVRPYTKSKAWAKCTIVVKDSLRPTSMTLSSGTMSLAIGQQATLTATLSPASAMQAVVYASSKTSVATVTSAGVVTAKKAGTAYIRVRSTRNTSLYRTIRVNVAKVPAPTSIAITPSDKTMSVGDKLQLTGTPSPSTASSSFGWLTSKSSVATVTSSGLVTAKKAGTVKITCYSKVKSTVRTVRTITVYDPDVVTSVTISKSGTVYLAEDDTLSLSASVAPAGATQSVTWKSSSASVATVTSSGKVTAQSPGTTVITAASTVNPSVKDTLTITVLDTTRTTEIPERITTTAGITKNLARIDAIRLSAYSELTSLVATGKISSAEAEKRKNIIINAFAMYRFPWMTSKRQAYWTSSYSGGKDFLVGNVYYGLPYIQCGTNGVYTNRMYNVVKALNGGYYTKSGNGYYMMSTTKKLNGMYVGNDCSAFVSMSIWGTSHAASYLATRYMATSSYYNTIANYDNLRPGDALVLGGSHTVMFLYFTNASKTRMMIIEQGGGTNPGGSDMHNTVCCSVVNVSSYVSKNYKVRRPNTLSRT